MLECSHHLVTDLPIWAECPYRIPRGIEVRRGKFSGDPEVVILWNPRTQQHVDLGAATLTAESFSAALNMLARKGC